MKKKIVGIFVCMLVIGFGSGVVADWDEGDGHKMHWPQLPDPNGWDVFCTAWSPQYPNIMLADDWECSESGFVQEIHFWGSWLGDNIGQIDYFLMGIAENIPPEQNPYGDWSIPGDTLIEWDIYNWVERGPYIGDQGWYWCFDEINPWQPGDHQQYWQYNVFLDEEDWFWQEQGTIYWLYIAAIVYPEEPVQPLWGWKSTLEPLQFMDDAVWCYIFAYEWLPLEYPTGTSMDLAFVINGEGEPAVPDLDCDGTLSFTDVEPGSTVTGSFTVENSGDPESLLDWEIESYPEWGTFTFDPDGGDHLTPEDGAVTVDVEIVAPEEEQTEFEGEIVLVNSEDASDTCTIDVSLATPVSHPSLLLWVLEHLASRFPVIAFLLSVVF